MNAPHPSSTPAQVAQRQRGTWSFLLLREDSGDKVFARLERTLPTIPLVACTITPNLLTVLAPLDAGPALTRAIAHDAIPALWEPPTPPPRGFPRFVLQFHLPGGSTRKLSLPLTAADLLLSTTRPVRPVRDRVERWIAWGLKTLGDRPSRITATAHLYTREHRLWSWDGDTGFQPESLTPTVARHLAELASRYHPEVA